MKTMIDEFRAFINRGNLLDLAIAVVLATFFAPIIAALVDGVIMNLIAAVFGQPDFNNIRLKIRGDGADATHLEFGAVITAVVQFIIVAWVCFLIIKTYNSWKGTTPVGDEEVEPGPTDIELLTEIRDSLRNR